MKNTLLAALLFLVPAGLSAQQTKLLTTEVKDPSAAAAPVKSTAAPAAVKPAPVKPKAPAAAAKPAAPAAAKPAAAPAAAKPAVPAKPAPVKKAAAQPAPVKEAAVIVPAKAETSSGGFAVGKKHEVVTGDTLWDLSGRYYKDPYKWGKIYNANMGTVQNPDRIYPREELVIPDITEEVRPELKKAPEITGAETEKEAELSSGDVTQAEEAAPAAAPAASAAPAPAVIAPVRAARAEVAENYKDAERYDLSEEMPVDMKEWADGVKIVPDNWYEDGVITAREKNGENAEADSLSSGGEMLSVSMDRAGIVKPGDYLAVYLQGSPAFDKAGKKLGREIQYAGMAEVVSVDGAAVKARVVDAVTAISKGYIVKKKK